MLADVNRAMLERGRTRLIDRGESPGRVHYARCDAERLPFPDCSFDRVLIGFGLRNVTRQDRALREMYRGAAGRPALLLVLEFSHLTVPALERAYDLYSLSVLPRPRPRGRRRRRQLSIPGGVGSPASGVRRALLAAMREAGFERRGYHNLTCGIVAVHRGYRL